MFAPRMPFTIGSVQKGYAAANAGIQIKDQIVGVNNIPIKYYDEFKEVITKFSDQNVELKVKRNGKLLDLPIHIPDSNIIGVSRYNYSIAELDKAGIYHLKTKHYSFFASFPAGFYKAEEKLVNYYKQFKMMLNPSTGAYKGMGGFASISKLFGTTWVWQNFWEKTAWISLVLAFMNLLPIPALDGGHVMFLLYEMVTRRKPNEKAMEYAQMAGMILLLAFMLYANTDFLRF